VDLYIHSPIRLHDVVLNELSGETTLPFLTRKTDIDGRITLKLIVKEEGGAI
jgi:hypothetical protein